jgi:hypothetical protein
MASVVLDPRLSTTAATTMPSAPRRWLVAPWFDALLIANVGWPLLLLLQWQEGFEGRAGLQFWQVYFVTTPHRWITLALVFLDRDRFSQRPQVFLGVLVVVVAACTAIRWGTGGLTCLLAVDYVWNAWHFAAQHQGIYRIYGRLNDQARGPGSSVLVERWLMRVFLLYVTLRVAVATWSDTTWQPILQTVDWWIPLIPFALLVLDIRHNGGLAAGRTLYLCSMSLLYLTLLWGVHTHQPALVLSLTTASALFHALEYIAIVSWTVHGKNASQHGAMGWLGVVASEWAVALCGFLVILGASAWLMDQRWREPWLFVNVIVAFLHYAYDGLIWRHRPAAVRTGQIP